MPYVLPSTQRAVQARTRRYRRLLTGGDAGASRTPSSRPLTPLRAARLALLAVAGAVAALSHVGSAENVAKSLDVTDLLVDATNLVGKKVTVNGCSFESVIIIPGVTSVICHSSSNTQIPLHIDTTSMERESLRRALKTCTGPARPNCSGSVTGTVSSGTLSPILGHATIEWAQ